MMLAVSALFLTRITLRIQNWRNAKLKVPILQFAHRYSLRDVAFRTIISKFTGKKLKAKLPKIDT